MLRGRVRIPVDDLQAVKLLATESPRQVYHAYLQARLGCGLPDCPVVGTGLAIFGRLVAARLQLVVVVPPVSGRADSGINRGPDRICANSRETAGPAVRLRCLSAARFGSRPASIHRVSNSVSAASTTRNRTLHLAIPHTRSPKSMLDTLRVRPTATQLLYPSQAGAMPLSGGKCARPPLADLAMRRGSPTVVAKSDLLCVVRRLARPALLWQESWFMLSVL